jgi:hypothetical protein
MSYLERLKAQKGAPCTTDKTDKRPSVSFVGSPGGPIPQATPAEETEIRAGIGRLCGFDHPDFPEALAVALADPRAALDALRNPSARMLAALEGEP